MKKKYAFLLMGSHYAPEIHRFRFETDRDVVVFRTVRDFVEAKEVAVELWKAGVGAIEVCGAFGPEKAAELTALTNGEVALGYVVHDPALDGVFARFFG